MRAMAVGTMDAVFLFRVADSLVDCACFSVLLLLLLCVLCLLCVR